MAVVVVVAVNPHSHHVPSYSVSYRFLVRFTSPHPALPCVADPDSYLLVSRLLCVGISWCNAECSNGGSFSLVWLYRRAHFHRIKCGSFDAVQTSTESAHISYPARIASVYVFYGVSISVAVCTVSGCGGDFGATRDINHCCHCHDGSSGVTSTTLGIGDCWYDRSEFIVTLRSEFGEW